MTGSASGVRIPYVSVRDTRGTFRPWHWLRGRHGRLSQGRSALALGVAMVAVPTLLAILYYALMASPVFVSEGRFAIRSIVEGNSLDVDALTGADGGSSGSGGGPGGGALSSAAGGLGKIGGLAGSLMPGGAAADSTQQDPFVVASYLTSPGLVQRLDEGGWLRGLFSRPGIDALSRLPKNASSEQLFAYWRRHVAAAVDRRSNIIQLHVRAYSAEDAQEIARRALAVAEAMIAELTRRQREDTLAVARSELAEAEARYETAGQRLRELRRDSSIVDPAREAQAAGTSLLKLLRERIRVRTELDTLKRLAGERAPGLVELNATIAGLEPQIEEASRRLAGDVSNGTVLAAVAALEELELERRFALTMLNVSTGIFDQARREAEHRASFLLAYLEPTLPAEATEPEAAASIALVAGLATIAWLFAVTGIAITLDQID